MPVLTVSDAELAWGDRPLLDHADFSLETGERIGLIGRNGAGKSSFLRVLARLDHFDAGEIIFQDNLTALYVEQEPVLPPAQTLRESLLVRGNFDSRFEERDRWSAEARLDRYLQRFCQNASVDPLKASGGEKKRAVLALAFALEPDLLLLDEPTNHLDVETILTLEELVCSEYRNNRSLIVITHDRSFLDAVSTRIIELDRGELRSYPGNFAAYEARKADELHKEDLARERFDKFLSQEEVWIRKGIEARRTRNEGRVKRLKELRVERAARRERVGHMQLTIDEGERSGKIVAQTTALSKSFGDRAIVKSLDFKLMRGDKLGLLGHNGTGKSTLIKLLLGELQPDSGSVKLGTNLKVAYYDQLRTRLDPGKTVADTVSPGSDWVEIGGVRKHIKSYLADFLFAPHRAEVPVANLSGGERNRLLLATLFALPANLLVLDEPTNDLDIDSLELLEETLENYTGTVILVSHDRRFLDNVVTNVLAPIDWEEPDGRWLNFVGGYTDWLAQRPAIERRKTSPASAAERKPATPKPYSKAPPAQRIRMSFKETRELEALPERIEALESEQAEILERMCSPDFHKTPVPEQVALKERSEALPLEIESAYARWEELSEKAQKAANRETL